MNAAGGIADGWTVELVVEDTNYNVEQHSRAVREDQGRGLGGWPVDGFADERCQPVRSMRKTTCSSFRSAGIPVGDSGVRQGLAFEQNTNYCIEAMNMWVHHDEQGAQSSRWSRSQVTMARTPPQA